MRLSMRKVTVLFSAALFGTICIFLYLCLESQRLTGSHSLYSDPGDFSSMELKLEELEHELMNNHHTINEIKKALYEIVREDNSSVQRLRTLVDPSFSDVEDVISMDTVKQRVLSLTGEECSFAEMPAQKSDVQMVDVNSMLKFDNPDGGVWKQGFNLQYTEDQWQDKPLKVFVVPHSHTDPGWLKTFDKYYHDQTRNIFASMLKQLPLDKRRRFIYAEISYFSVWWEKLDETQRATVRRLIEDGQLEIVTGGWVMTDEANSHYYAIIDQLIEGHQWLELQLGVKPTSGWSIDPFGHSSTMAYILKRVGLTNMLLQRVHYSVKKHFAREKQLEFMWRQNWDHNSSTDMFTHMMPFYSYDVPHTCGPDPKICCQFDFKRLPLSKVRCPWRIPAQAITDTNVHERSHLLLDQYRKKSLLYRSNVVLVPLGDDFRWDTTKEWDDQITNYQKLFDYMNKQAGWNVEAKFGTLKEYFDAIWERNDVLPGQRPPGFPVISGDFFTYADKDDHYWAGYFTTRPFYKNMDRVLEAALRGAEVLFSVAQAHARRETGAGAAFPTRDLMAKMVRSRRALGLFQHHDAITGTGKDFVMADYGMRMFHAIADVKAVTNRCAHYLLTGHNASSRYDPTATAFFDLDEVRAKFDTLPVRNVVDVKVVPRVVMLYNSLAQQRRELVSLHVTSPQVIVQDMFTGKQVEAQVNPVWEDWETISDTRFELVFVARVPAIGLRTYNVTAVSKVVATTRLGKVALFNSRSFNKQTKSVFSVVIPPSPELLFSIENAYMRALFSPRSGLLQSVTLKEDDTRVKTELEFLKYGTREKSKDKSGAYLFLPDGEAKPLVYAAPLVRVVRGNIVSEVHVFLPHVEQVVRLTNSPGVDIVSLDIVNLVDIKLEKNKELVMRVYTDVTNHNREFYTDLNGFQMQKRRTRPSMPLQADVYPMSTMAYVESESTRVSILTGQALGCTSRDTGQLEVIQDRRLMQDDQRGLMQGLLDNKRTANKFRLLVERRQRDRVDKLKAGGGRSNNTSVSFPSLLGHWSSATMLHPIVMATQNVAHRDTPLLSGYAGLADGLPCDIHLVNLRTLQEKPVGADDFQPKDEAAMLLHRFGHDCSFPARAMQCDVSGGKVALSGLFKDLEIAHAEETTLSLMHSLGDKSASSSIKLEPMEINTYKVRLK